MELLIKEIDLNQDLTDLYIACFNAPGKSENWNTDSAHTYFLSRLQEGSILFGIKNNNNQLIAAACGGDYNKSFIRHDLHEHILENCFYISLIMVAQDWSGKGLATKLLKHLTTYCSHTNYSSLLVRCRTSNNIMQHVLHKEGFTPLTNYYSDVGGVSCERVVFIKSLT